MAPGMSSGMSTGPPGQCPRCLGHPRLHPGALLPRCKPRSLEMRRPSLLDSTPTKPSLGKPGTAGSTRLLGSQSRDGDISSCGCSSADWAALGRAAGPSPSCRERCWLSSSGAWSWLTPRRERWPREALAHCQGHKYGLYPRGEWDGADSAASGEQQFAGVRGFGDPSLFSPAS